MKFMTKLKALGAALLIATAVPASAQDWKPSKPITIEIGFGAGGSTDTMGRVLAEEIKAQTGWNVIVENRPGGGGVAMFTSLSQRPADNHTIGMGVGIPVLVQLVQRGDQLPFDVDSFDYLGTVAKAELALVASSKAPFNSLQEMIAYAKKEGNMPLATMAPPQVLMMKATTKAADVNFNLVTADGGAEVMKLILGGQVLAGFASGEHVPYMESGDMKVIASANQARLSYAPDVPTFIESGVDAYVDAVFFLAMKAGSDPAAVEAIAAAIDAAVKTPKMAEIVKNAVQGDPINMGRDGAKAMMVDGLDNAKKLFAN
ncbi:MAG: Bug family tripartite tricarboxylate transporter substrate binding protein [Hyphomicrobiales bacterium]